MYYVYIIKCRRDGRRNFGDIVYYTGFTNNPKKRLYEHQIGIKSKWMKRYKINAQCIVYIESFLTPEQAMKREQQIKRLGKKAKKRLITEYEEMSSLQQHKNQ